MLIDLHRIKAGYAQQQEKQYLQQAPKGRSRFLPRLWHYDYLSLKALARDLQALTAELPYDSANARIALDVGAGESPYRTLLEARGYTVETLDLTAESHPTYIGSIDALPLADSSIDLVFCSQVLEHVPNPWKAMKEFSRVLKPGGRVIFSVPHVWFYHPHPDDYYRFTAEGVIALCEAAELEPESLLSQGGSILCAGQIFSFLAFGILGVIGAPLYLITNLIAGLCDRMLPDALFCINFACRAVKR